MTYIERFGAFVASIPVGPLYRSVQLKPRLCAAVLVAFVPSRVTVIGSRSGESFAVAKRRSIAIDAVLETGDT